MHANPNMISNSHQVFVIDSFAQPVSATLSSTPMAANVRRRIKKSQQQPVIDVIVVLLALPSLTILALLLEANTRGDWLETREQRLTVLGLGIALAAVCLALCIYVTSRIGGKMWSGAIPSEGSGPHYSYYNPRSTYDEMNDKPPSYDVVMGFDIPPPPYSAIIIEGEIKDTQQFESYPKFIAIQHM